MRISSKETLKNFIYVFLSQSVSLILSVMMSFIIPKILNIEGFGYWQFFLLLCSYVGFFHFGLIDGIYLRYGGKYYSKTNNERLGSQLIILGFIEFFVAFCFMFFSYFNNYEIAKTYIIFSFSIYLVISNISNFFGVIYQSFNLLKLFSFLAIFNCQ